MKNKTYRFAVAAALLLSLCLVFIMPVGAVETVTEVSDWNDLKLAMESGCSVKLVSDVKPDTTLTKTDYLLVKENTILDLNGKTIYAEYATSESFQLIKIAKDKSLTINDNSEEKAGLIFLNYTDGETNAWDDTLSVINVENFATLIINDGTLKIESVSGSYNGFYAVDFSTRSGTSKFTMNGGKLISEYIGLRVPLSDNTANSVVTINNGEIDSRYQCIWIQQTSQSGTRSYELTINNGIFTSKNSAAIAYWLMCNDDAGTYVTIIKGGQFTGTPTSSYPGIIGYYNAYISGQDPSTKKWIYQPIDIDKHTLTIDGGSFTMTNVDIIGILYNDMKVPTVSLSATITGDDKVSTQGGFIGEYTVSPIGKSYEWFVDNEKIGTTTTNTWSHKFDPVGAAMPSVKSVSVNVILSDKYSVTTEPITVTVPAEFTVTFNAGGGTGTTFTGVAYSDEASFTLPDCTFTAPEEKTFDAWLIDGNKYAAGVSYTVTADTSVTAVWKDVGAAVEPTIDTSVNVETSDTGVTTTTITLDENTIVEDDTVTIIDESTGVTIDIKFEDEISGTTEASGVVSSVTVNYQPEQTSVSENADNAEITQTVSFTLSKVTTDLPTIKSDFDQTKADKVIEDNPNHKPLAMITADNAESVNNNMTKGIDKVTVTFKLPQALVESLVGTDISLLKAYHVKDDGEVIEADIDVEGPTDGIYTVKVTGDGFSSYVLGYEEPKQTVSNGGGKDTGSGNYQYYPRDVPTNGIVDFGTSKVVKGMELPAGSSGKVTLNTKPTFAMPENGFYAFEIDAPGYNLDAKINGGLSFQIPEADLTAAGWTAKDIVLYHGTVAEDGKIIWEALPTNLVKNENGIAYYKSAINGCSPFYIGFVKDGSVVNTEVVDPITPPTDEPTDVPGEVLPEIPPVDEPETPATPVPLFAVLAGLGAAVVLRRK